MALGIIEISDEFLIDFCNLSFEFLKILVLDYLILMSVKKSILEPVPNLRDFIFLFGNDFNNRLKYAFKVIDICLD